MTIRACLEHVASGFAHGMTPFTSHLELGVFFVGYAFVDSGWRCLRFRIAALILGSSEDDTEMSRETDLGTEGHAWERRRC
jgi:hypothetical protein